jgi:RNA 2',3'-cyclic 3'-phosphodiesterase
MRLFVAIPLPEQTTAQIGQTIALMRQGPQAHDLRWSAAESWHITLQFLGIVETQQYPCLIERLRSVHAAPLKIAPEGIATFARAGILYAGVKPSPQLLQLQKSITAATGACGFSPEDRPYRPHVTLARVRGSRHSREISAILQRSAGIHAFQPFTADQFALYETVPGGQAHYVIRERFPLV